MSNGIREKKYYFKKYTKHILIPLTLICIGSFLLWNGMDPLFKILTVFVLFLTIYLYVTLTYTEFYIDEEGLKETSPVDRNSVIRWEDLQAVKWDKMAREETNWRDYPTFVARVCSEKSYIYILNYIEDYEELMERFLEECDRRGLGEKVEYKVRAKVWELLDAKREEEEWEDEEMDEEWEEEEDE